MTKTDSGLPLVSVVMTTYNGEAYLAEQLESILDQDYINLEVLVGDDGSTDGTREVLRRYAEQDSRIHLYFHEENLGLNGNLEFLLSECQGEFVAIADQDDIWLDNKISVLVANIGEAAGIYSDSEMVDSSGNRIGKSVLGIMRISMPAEGDNPLRLFLKNNVSGHALLFRRSVISGPFLNSMVYDHQLACLAMIRGGLKFYEHPLVLHRIHDTNQVNSGLGRDEAAIENLAGLDDAASASLKIERRGEKRKFFCESINAFIELLSKSGYPVPDRLYKIQERIKRYDNGFFDFVLLYQLLCMRKILFYGHNRQVRRCIDLAKGRRYYNLAKRINTLLGDK